MQSRASFRVASTDPAGGDGVAFEGSYRSSALPTAGELQEYDGVINEGAERIMRMAESQLAADQKEQNRRSLGALFVQIVSSIVGAIMVLSGVLGGLYLCYLGRDLGGLSSLFSTVGLIAGSAYFAGKSDRAKKNSNDQ